MVTIWQQAGARQSPTPWKNYLAAPALVGPYLGNLVWNDINGNGIHDPSELGLPGITVQLFSPGVDGVVNTVDDTLINSTTTTSTGSYLFSAIAPIPANYYVKFLAPTNYFISPQNQGTDNTINSKADPATGDTALIPVNSTTNNLTIDCGMFQQAISINDVSQTEGNSGTTTNYVFTVTITPAAVSVTNVPYFTSDGTATVADNDYIPTSGVLNFAIGVSSLTVSVTVIGDTKIENDEYFNLNITPPTGFVATKTRGIGTIIKRRLPRREAHRRLLGGSTGQWKHPLPVHDRNFAARAIHRERALQHRRWNRHLGA